MFPHTAFESIRQCWMCLGPRAHSFGGMVCSFFVCTKLTHLPQLHENRILASVATTTIPNARKLYMHMHKDFGKCWPRES